METSLHRQLKEVFRLPESEIEVKVGRYRIDVVNEGRLVEIQQSGLSSIRDKVANLLKNKHQVDVIKPLVSRKRLIKLNKKAGRVVDTRWSPKKGTVLDLFDELVYFTRVFPHRNLHLIVPLVEIEETRFPGHGRRRRWRKTDFQIEDRRLVKVEMIHDFRSAVDLHRLLPDGLPSPFDTGELAEGLGIARGQARRIAYVLRNTGSAEQVGKKGNALLYELTLPSEARSKTRKRRAAGQATAKSKVKRSKVKRSKVKRKPKKSPPVSRPTGPVAAKRKRQNRQSEQVA